MSSSIAGVVGGGIRGGAIIGIGGGGMSTTSLAPGLYISTKTKTAGKQLTFEGLVKTGCVA